MIIIYSIWPVLLIVILLFIRIRLIIKEIDETWEVKKRGFIEFILQKHIAEDLERIKGANYIETKEKPLKREILQKTKKVLTNNDFPL